MRWQHCRHQALSIAEKCSSWPGMLPKRNTRDEREMAYGGDVCAVQFVQSSKLNMAPETDAKNGVTGEGRRPL
jgi:hypothetical protein